MRIGRKIAITSLLLALALVAGCSSGETPAEEPAAEETTQEAVSLEGTSWNCISFNAGGVPSEVPTDAPITAEFNDGTMSGNATINSYSTSYETDGGNITLGSEITTTKMAGPDDKMRQESDYLTALGTVKTFKIDEKSGQLVLFGAAQNTVARYNPAE